MAYAGAARDEDHRNRNQLRHEERIMISPADHLLVRGTTFVADSLEQLDDIRRAVGWRICVHQLFDHSDTASALYLIAVLADGRNDSLATDRVGIAKIDLQDHAAGHAVDRA